MFRLHYTVEKIVFVFFMSVFGINSYASILDPLLVSYQEVDTLTDEDAKYLGPDKVSFWSKLPVNLSDEVVVFDWDETLCASYTKRTKDGKKWLRYFPIHHQSLDKIISNLLDRGATVIILTASSALRQILSEDQHWQKSFAKIGQEDFGFSKNTLERMAERFLEKVINRENLSKAPIFYAPVDPKKRSSSKALVLGRILLGLNVTTCRFLDDLPLNTRTVAQLTVEGKIIFTYLLRSELLLSKYLYYQNNPALLENQTLGFWLKGILGDKINLLSNLDII